MIDDKTFQVLKQNYERLHKLNGAQEEDLISLFLISRDNIMLSMCGGGAEH